MMTHNETFKEATYRIIFGTNSPAGRNFDLALIMAIIVSVVVIALDSIDAVHSRYTQELFVIEWFFTLLFTLEYALRLYCSPHPKGYAKSFYGIVDLLSILPSYISLLFPAANLLLVVRLLRVMRIFRILKLFQYSSEASLLVRSLLQSHRKIFIFLFTVLVSVVIFGSLMYIVEGPEYGFTSIPKSIYWAIVTVTTVGYGDITPHTIIGQFIAALAMMSGYAIIAVPTGIISAELMNEMQLERSDIRCTNCEKEGHEASAHYCKHCGTSLHLDPIVEDEFNASRKDKTPHNT
ncbi:MAG: ion transporter [Pseudomonadota bacterium]